MAAFVSAPCTTFSQLHCSSFRGASPVRRAPSPLVTVPRRASLRHRFTPAATAATPSSNSITEKVVDELLDLVKDTDVGREANDQRCREIADHVAQLYRYNNRPLLEDPTIFDNYNVAYSRSRQSSEPAGGLFRSKLGSAIFRTTGIFQHILRPNIVINAVAFRFLGILSGIVVLRGKIESLKDTDPGQGPNAIAIDFESPRIMFGPALFKYGPESRVRLTLAHLDERVRLGIGRRGTILVFTRCEEGTPHVDDWKLAMDKKPLPTILLPISALAIIGVTFLAPLVVRLGILAVIVGAGFILRYGGNASSRPDGFRDRVANKTGSS